MFENTPPPGGFGTGDDAFGDLDDFGGAYKPETAFRRSIDTLADGPYDFQIVSAALERTQQTQDRICRIVLQVIGGPTVEWTEWLNNERAVCGFGADMAALGFPAHTWGAGPGKVPLSKAIPECVGKLPGIKFRAQKTSRKDTRPGMGDKVYHNLAISCRIEGRPMPAATPPAQPTPNESHPLPTSVGAASNEIPF